MNDNYRSLNSLMRHIRESGISIAGGTNKRVLAQVGYFHGYKGYRYSGSPARRIPYTDFGELRAVVDFDTKIKSLLYPVLMSLEMSMKNLALVEILDAADSSSLSDVYGRLMPGTKRNGLRGKLEVIHSSNGVLLTSYKKNNAIARHYYDSPIGAVPIWGLMEVVTLGHFARFLEQLSDPTLNGIAERWGLQRKYGELAPHLVLAMTGLRNCVAHNGIVFDTRFATAKVRTEIRTVLHNEIGYPATIQLGFDTITDYFILVAYLACTMGVPKREVRSLIKNYTAHTDELFGRVPLKIFNMIIHTDNRTKIAQLERWVRNK